MCCKEAQGYLATFPYRGMNSELSCEATCIKRLVRSFVELPQGKLIRSTTNLILKIFKPHHWFKIKIKIYPDASYNYLNIKIFT